MLNNEGASYFAEWLEPLDAQCRFLMFHLIEGIDRALYINVNTEELYRRLAGRWICRSCQTPYHEHSSPPAVAGKCDRCVGDLYQRDDDNAEAVQKRLGVFFKETEPLVQFYRETGILREVDGVGTVDGVGAALLEAVAE